MYNPSIWSVEMSEGRRSYVGRTLIELRHNGPMHMSELGVIIGILTREPIPEPLKGDRKAFHNSKYRRLLSDDIDALNRDPEYPLCIKSDSKGVRVCTKEEAEAMERAEYREAVKKLAKCSVLRRKAGRDGQIDITGAEIEAFAREGGAA
jgi:hypothetical protein